MCYTSQVCRWQCSNPIGFTLFIKTEKWIQVCGGGEEADKNLSKLPEDIGGEDTSVRLNLINSIQWGM